jgi:hypothetical protein
MDANGDPIKEQAPKLSQPLANRGRHRIRRPIPIPRGRGGFLDTTADSQPSQYSQIAGPSTIGVDAQKPTLIAGLLMEWPIQIKEMVS